MTTMTKEETFELIKELRDERVDVEEVYIGCPKPKDTIEEIIQLEEPYYDADAEVVEVLPVDEITQEIFDIADSAVLAHLMESGESELPVYSMKKDLGASQEVQLLEWDATSDIMEHIDLMVLSSLLHRNWGAFETMSTDEIIAGIQVFYPNNDPAIVEAAIYSLLFAVQAERAA